MLRRRTGKAAAKPLADHDSHARTAGAARGWWAACVRSFWRIQSHRTGLVAAGCAFYATLALFPALSMLVSLYGLWFDPASVAAQLELLEGLLPPDAYSLIQRQVVDLVARPRATLGWNLAVSGAVALWSASTGTKSMIAALNLAYEEEERRSILGFQAVGLAMTAAAILAAIVTVGMLVALPPIVAALHLPTGAAGLVHWASVLMLIGFVFASLGFLYGAGPSRARGRRRVVLPGVLLATLLWLVASYLFTAYATHFGQFGAVYGPLAAVAAVMLWFWVSAYVVLLGAELNSAREAELSLAQDTGIAGTPPAS
jgi:membrane protein